VMVNFTELRANCYVPVDVKKFVRIMKYYDMVQRKFDEKYKDYDADHKGLKDYKHDVRIKKVTYPCKICKYPKSERFYELLDKYGDVETVQKYFENYICESCQKKLLAERNVRILWYLDTIGGIKGDEIKDNGDYIIVTVKMGNTKIFPNSKPKLVMKILKSDIPDPVLFGRSAQKEEGE